MGSDDEVVPAEYSIDSAQPGAIEVIPVIGADHMDLIDPTGEAWAAVVRVLDDELA